MYSFCTSSPVGQEGTESAVRYRPFFCALNLSPRALHMPHSEEVCNWFLKTVRETLHKFCDRSLID